MYSRIEMKWNKYWSDRKRIKDLQVTVYELTDIVKNSPQEQQFALCKKHCDAFISIWTNRGLVDIHRLEALHVILPDTLDTFKKELGMIATTIKTIHHITENNFASPYRTKWENKAFKKRDHIINRILDIEAYMRKLTLVMNIDSTLSSQS